jgi:hypothetical protein
MLPYTDVVVVTVIGTVELPYGTGLPLGLGMDEPPLGVVAFFGAQRPPPNGNPLSHLQLGEHPSPATTLPSSHSSPN